MTTKDWKDFLNDLGFSESSGDYTNNKNKLYKGKYQMGEAALKEAGYYKPNTKGAPWSGKFTGKDGVYSLEDFLNNPEAQDNAIKEYTKKQWGYIKGEGLDKYVGKTINGVKITPSGVIAGAHLVGPRGSKEYYETNGKVMPKDGNNTPIEKYLDKFKDYNVSDITGPINTPYTYKLYEKASKDSNAYKYSDFFTLKKLQEINSSPTGYAAPIEDIFYATEDIKDMTNEEFGAAQEIIDNQLKNKIAIPRIEANQGVGQGLYIYVKDYVRDDGVKVKGYYRRR